MKKEKLITFQEMMAKHLKDPESNPTLGTLRKVADALGAKVMVTFK